MHIRVEYGDFIERNSAIAIRYLMKQQMVLNKRLHVNISLVLEMTLQLMTNVLTRLVDEGLCEQLGKLKCSFTE